jgi:hypothetical protein
MSWNKLRVFGIFAGAALATSALVGCAGSGTLGPDPGSPFIPATGGVNQQTGVDGSGDQVAVIKADSPLIDGLRASGFFTSDGRQDDRAGVIQVRRRGAQGFEDTGVRVTRNGTLTGDVLLQNGWWEINVIGPLSIVKGGDTLTMAGLRLDGVVRNGVASVPGTISGQLPVDGGTTFGLQLNGQLPAQFNGRTELEVLHNNGGLFQSRNVVNGAFDFRGMAQTGNATIPRTGLNLVHWRYLEDGFPN